jgi:hypothetical protein
MPVKVSKKPCPSGDSEPSSLLLDASGAPSGVSPAMATGLVNAGRGMGDLVSGRSVLLVLLDDAEEQHG